MPRRLEDCLTMPAGQEEAESVEIRVLKEAEDFYNDVFGPLKESTKPLDPDLNKLRKQLKSK